MEGTTRIVAVVGPESTGKTTLATRLAEHLKAPLVEEYAREYLADRTGYSKQDLTKIAEGQFNKEQEAINSGSPIIVCDTDLTVIKVWSDAKYGDTDPTVSHLLHQQPNRFFLLAKPDIPWVADSLRESPHDREELFVRYERLLEEMGCRYAVVEGDGDARWERAVKAFSEFS